MVCKMYSSMSMLWVVLGMLEVGAISSFVPPSLSINDLHDVKVCWGSSQRDNTSLKYYRQSTSSALRLRSDDAFQCRPVGRHSTSSSFQLRAVKKRDNGGSTASENKDIIFYNDDAFGLVFLSASLVVRDFSFAASFLLLSGIASAVVSANIVQFQPLLPGVIAFASLALSKLDLLSDASQTFGGSFVMPLNENGATVEFVICAISLIWGIIQQAQRQIDLSSDES